MWLEINVYIPLRKENIFFGDTEDLFNVFFSWLCLQDKTLLDNSRNWLEDELREINSESDTTNDGKKTSEQGKKIKALELEKNKFGGKLEHVLFRLKYNIK